MLNHHHHVRVAGEGRRVVAPPARPQRSPIGRVESFRNWSSWSILNTWQQYKLSNMNIREKDKTAAVR